MPFDVKSSCLASTTLCLVPVVLVDCSFPTALVSGFKAEESSWREASRWIGMPTDRDSWKGMSMRSLAAETSSPLTCCNLEAKACWVYFCSGRSFAESEGCSRNLQEATLWAWHMLYIPIGACLLCSYMKIFCNLSCMSRWKMSWWQWTEKSTSLNNSWNAKSLHPGENCTMACKKKYKKSTQPDQHTDIEESIVLANQLKKANLTSPTVLAQSKAWPGYREMV